MIKNSFSTHDGTFHADEVTACALLLLFDLIDKDKIYRTRDLKVIEQCEYVCDVGKVYAPEKKRFDHHQLSYHGPLSSAGMVLEYLHKSSLFEKDLFLFIKEELIDGIDAFDTGNVIVQKGHLSFSEIIANFLPVEYTVSPVEEDEAFLQALDFTISFLERMRKRYLYQREFVAIIKKEMEKNKEYLIFDDPFPWKENFFALGGESHPAKFIVMPTQNQWKLRCIPPSLKDPMNMRLPHPEEWAGLFEKDLQAKTKISSAVFCHKNRFISIWKTKEGAIEALKQILHIEDIG